MKKLVVALLVFAACKPSSTAEPEVKALVTVKVAPAALGELDEALSVPATIYPREKANITSALTAPIRALHARKGDRVTKGQVLAQLEDRDLVAQRGEAVAAVHAAQVLGDRRRQLFQQGAIPERDLLAVETDLAQSKARLDKIEAQLHFTELRSPFAGSITEQFLYAGDMVKPDAPVFTVADMSVAVARAQVPETEVVAVKRGQGAAFSSEAAGDEPVRGQVTMVNQAVDPTRRTVEVWCELPNGDGRLRDGVFGHVSIATGRPQRRVLVPRAAVQVVEGSTEGSVMVVDGKSVARKREVKLRGQTEDRVAVEGVKPGELVVISAGYGLPDGTAVKIETENAKDEDKGETGKPERDKEKSAAAEAKK
jgi:RND family efflux transporter MFP subunit